MKIKFLTLAFILSSFMPFVTPFVQAQVPAVDINKGQNSPSDPFGGFKLVNCDGPAALNTWATHQVKDALGNWVNDPNWPGPSSTFKACDFGGLMSQVQYLINVMITLGVIGAMIGFAYVGYLYITGTSGNLTKAHAIFPKIFWGFIIMLTAWFVVYQILQWLTGNAAGYLMTK